MVRVTLVSIGLALLAACASAPVAQVGSNPEAVQQAVATAEGWLAKVDLGRYDDAWHEMAPVVQSQLSIDQWGQVLTATRKPLGFPSIRRVLEAHFLTEVPGAPKGEYVLIRFETGFQNLIAIETVTPMRDQDGQWRVAGYFLKKDQ